MTPRADFLALLTRNRRRVDAERREFARRAVEILERVTQGEQVFGYVAHARVMGELESLLSEFYGSSPSVIGGRFGRLILEECRQARALAFQRSVQDVRRRLKGERGLLRAMEREA